MKTLTTTWNRFVDDIQAMPFEQIAVTVLNFDPDDIGDADDSDDGFPIESSIHNF